MSYVGKNLESIERGGVETEIQRDREREGRNITGTGPSQISSCDVHKKQLLMMFYLP